MLKSIESAQKKVPKNATLDNLIISIVRAEQSYKSMFYRNITFEKWWLVIKGYEDDKVV